MRLSQPAVQKLTKLTVASIALTLAACGRSDAGEERNAITPPEPIAGAFGSYAGEGRDRMCLVDGKPDGGLITYAPSGNNNCSLRFATRYAEGSATEGTFAAANDPSCTIPFTRVAASGRFTLGQPSPGCAYYCGPGAALANKSFVRMDKATPVTDIAGEPLC